ncbi:hypothetical protein EW145_g1313 [Phellinidium pouzarii]|uniref:UspA domain-containing protein n=1 Tax=Phellinidium pouzarii TaxID=167371 RepID=A0A4S4LF10_9AGAM|nr:hypothetical protein EW145_g1313 [Phellinidium pouzarii]
MSTDRHQSSSAASRKLGWMSKSKYTTSKDKDSHWMLPSPPEGREATGYTLGLSIGGGLPFARSSSSSALSGSHPSAYSADRPSFPSRRSSTSSVMTKQQLDEEASKIILSALDRTSSTSTQDAPGRLSSTFSRNTDDKERGRSRMQEADRPRSASVITRNSADEAEPGVISRARSTSPFLRKRARGRDPSPSVEALKLSQSDVESDIEGPPSRASIRPRNAFTQSSTTSDDDSADEADDDGASEESWSDNDMFDSITEQNTEQNSLITTETLEHDTLDAPDPLGEGVNIVVPPEPYFPSTLNARERRNNPRRKKSTRHVSLPLTTSRTVFMRDRCTITLTQGDPTHALELNARRSRRYVVASDLSEESRYAVEWGIGTVLKDGDEMILVSVNENEAKVDPPNPNPSDRVSKLRNQQERQGLAYILVRQVIGLLQRTKLHVTVACQAWHAKNSRHMLLDIVDHIEPTMLIVGSRGLGQLKGILLGSTSHYLVQKCSVPVMVARRRLKRPARRSAHLSPHRARVSLAEAAGVERTTPKVDRDVEDMRNELERDDERRENQGTEDFEDDVDTEHEGDALQIGQKVAGY